MKKILSFLLFFTFIMFLGVDKSKASSGTCSGSVAFEVACYTIIADVSQPGHECYDNDVCDYTAATATDDAKCGVFGDGNKVTPSCINIRYEAQCKSISGCGWALPSDTDNNSFTQKLCNALKIVTGNGGKAFAAFAIISLGIGFFTGKVSWGLMLGVSAGIAAMFGAPTIVAAISGEDSFDCGS